MFEIPITNCMTMITVRHTVMYVYGHVEHDKKTNLLKLFRHQFMEIVNRQLFSNHL